MTLGRLSLRHFLPLLLLVGGCAAGEVTGTGSRGFDDSRTGPTPDDDTTTGAAGTSQSSSPPASDESGPVDYDALFDAPADPTTTDDLVTGLWAGTTYYGEVRLRISANKVLIAIKCGNSPAEGMEVGAVVTSNKLKTLASKSIGSSGYCGIKVTPVEIPRCTTDLYYDCFDLSGTTLTFSGKTLFSGGGSSSEPYTKLSD